MLRFNVLNLQDIAATMRTNNCVKSIVLLKCSIVVYLISLIKFFDYSSSNEELKEWKEWYKYVRFVEENATFMAENELVEMVQKLDQMIVDLETCLPEVGEWETSDYKSVYVQKRIRKFVQVIQCVVQMFLQLQSTLPQDVHLWIWAEGIQRLLSISNCVSMLYGPDELVDKYLTMGITEFNMIIKSMILNFKLGKIGRSRYWVAHLDHEPPPTSIYQSSITSKEVRNFLLSQFLCKPLLSQSLCHSMSAQTLFDRLHSRIDKRHR